jgi:TM2 domain-containing membrane protein YozV
MVEGAVKVKEPILSVILSFILPGLGQVYNGQAKKGIILLAGYILMWIASFVLMIVLIGFCLMLIPIVIWLYAMYDAYVTADKVNKGEPTKDWL